MPATTPLSRSKTSALTRVVDAVGKGYTCWTSGTVSADKIEYLARKFHEKFGIGCTPAQRVTRRKHKLPNTLLAIYCPENSKTAEWALLATNRKGDSPVEGEKLIDVSNRTRLIWLGYELVRHSYRGKTIWTWKRPKAEMAEHYAMVAEYSNQKHFSTLAEYMQRLANQPGFHGVREQTFALFEEAQKKGYNGPVPHIYYVQRVNHGERLVLDQTARLTARPEPVRKSTAPVVADSPAEDAPVQPPAGQLAVLDQDAVEQPRLRGMKAITAPHAKRPHQEKKPKRAAASNARRKAAKAKARKSGKRPTPKKADSRHKKP